MLEKGLFFTSIFSISILFYFINDKRTICRTAENIFSVSSARKFRPAFRQIHFIRSWPQKEWDAPTLCAVYSAANYNPNFTIIVHVMSNLSFPQQWKHLSNIEIRYTNLGDVFRLFVDTPLLQWYPKFLMKATDDVRILSDAMRMAIVVLFNKLLY